MEEKCVICSIGRLRNAVKRACARAGAVKRERTFSIINSSPAEAWEKMSKFVGKPCVVCSLVIIDLKNSELDHIKPNL